MKKFIDLSPKHDLKTACKDAIEQFNSLTDNLQVQPGEIWVEVSGHRVRVQGKLDRLAEFGSE